jgi:capsular exopolysaccharide synthesis family protein
MPEEVKLVPRERRFSDSLEVISAPLPYLPLELPSREPHLRDYYIILRKHLWVMLTFLLTLVTVTTIATFKMVPVYQATARLAIDRENQGLVPFQEAAGWEYYYDSESYLETQCKILQSETLALTTIKSLSLANQPEFSYGGGKQEIVGPAQSKDTARNRPAILGDFLGRLSAKRVPNSRLVEVRFEATDPKLAAQVVNAHLENYIESNFRSRYEATLQASNWLSGQLDELKIKVEKSEDARLVYERENQIWTIDEKQNITTQKLADLNTELTQAQSDRIRKESLYQSARLGNLDAIPAVRDSLVIQDLLRRFADLSAQYSEALNRFGPKYPQVVRLETQMKELDELIKREKQNIVSRIESEYRSAQRREALLAQALEKQKVEANQIAEKLVQYNVLKREAESNKQLYEGLLQKLKEAGISAGLRSSNIRIVDPAMIPSSPVRPQRARNIMLAFFIGLVGGIGLAFLREYLDNTIKTPEDIERLTRLPSLAIVPAFTAVDGRSRRTRLLPSGSQRAAGATPRVELIAHEQPQSLIAESFRALRTSLLLSQAEHPPQVILVASPLPREGKTTAALNLAVTLAQLGDRTVLVDADLRKPTIHRALGLSDGKYSGLSTYLAGASSLELVTVPHPVIGNLSIIPTGPIPPNPAELLSSQRLQQAIATLRANHRFVVIDSPPILAATDAVILSVVCDGVLIVVRSGETPKEALLRVRDLLATVKCRLLGVLLNAVDISAPDYYYSYRYYPYEYSSRKHDSPDSHSDS